MNKELTERDIENLEHWKTCSRAELIRILLYKTQLLNKFLDSTAKYLSTPPFGVKDGKLVMYEYTRIENKKKW